MEGPTTQPLTVAQAKDRLRTLADETTVDLFEELRTHPGTFGLAALIGGVLLGSTPSGRKTLVRLVGWLVPGRADDWRAVLGL